MFGIARIFVVAGFVVTPAELLGQSVTPPGVRASASPAFAEEETAHAIEEFEGVWVYNDAESVNAANGRPERASRSATQRGVPAAGGNRPAPPRGGGGPFDGFGPEGRGGGRGGGGLGVGPTPEMMRETRNLGRDLLEIPEALTIDVDTESVSFTDDIARERVYPTTGAKQKYQLGAARFDALLEWNGSRLTKKIEGPYGFRMTETYFLSADAQRLFVIIRVGEQKKDQPPVGFNRVYDRLNTLPPS